MNKHVFKQSFLIPKPVFTEETMLDQSNKVFIVTGGYSGIGYELVKILFSKNGRVYIAGRSQRKASEAIAKLERDHSTGSGSLEFLQVDLSDLTTIKRATDAFLAREKRLDVLTNNAGIGDPPAGSQSAQGHELQLATNCLGPFLFTQLLLPILQQTAATSPPGSVRVTWAGSLTTEVYAPEGGVSMIEAGVPVISRNQRINYGQSKAGNVFIASELARRYGEAGIISVAWNPGNLRTDLMRHWSWIERTYTNLMLYPPKLGAYTQLYAGWSPDITLKTNGSYIVPWGQIGPLRRDIELASKTKGEGGSGKAEEFWRWCERETSQFT